MPPGFPKATTKEKLSRGRYRITREDGRKITVVQGVGRWLIEETSTPVKTLRLAEYDFRHGFTALDQLERIA